MERPVTRSGGSDRRRVKRNHGHVLGRLRSVRIRPGHVAQVINWSAQGALIETEMCLIPGSHVALQLICDNERLVVGSRVIRCSVSNISPGGRVSYRGGLLFDSRTEFGHLTKDQGDVGPPRKAHHRC